MLKIIVFDYGGVLVRERDIKLTQKEDMLERFFGKNYSDEKYVNMVKKIEPERSKVLKIAEEIINKLYEIKDEDLFAKIKRQYPNVTICIATNHISYIEKHIRNTMDMQYIDKIFVSAIMHKTKPHLNYYREIIQHYHLKPEEFLFIDDNQENVEGAIRSGMHAIKIEKKEDVYQRVIKVLNEQKNK